MGFKFFLYGVYDEGQKCHSRFQNLISSQQKAQVRGTLYQLSCGLTLLQPEGEALVSGLLVDLNINESHWPYLDAMNGYNECSPKKSFLLRKTVEVILADGSSIQAQTYCINDDKKTSAKPVTEPVAVPQKEILIDRLTDRQQLYIRKLSQAKGREIVPVDMALYRELMSLELIVDKGRRLALTSLGQEVSLFL